MFLLRFILFSFCSSLPIAVYESRRLTHTLNIRLWADEKKAVRLSLLWKLTGRYRARRRETVHNLNGCELLLGISSVSELTLDGEDRALINERVIDSIIVVAASSAQDNLVFLWDYWLQLLKVFAMVTLTSVGIFHYSSCIFKCRGLWFILMWLLEQFPLNLGWLCLARDLYPREGHLFWNLVWVCLRLSIVLLVLTVHSVKLRFFLIPFFLTLPKV